MANDKSDSSLLLLKLFRDCCLFFFTLLCSRTHAVLTQSNIGIGTEQLCVKGVDATLPLTLTAGVGKRGI